MEKIRVKKVKEMVVPVKNIVEYMKKVGIKEYGAPHYSILLDENAGTVTITSGMKLWEVPTDTERFTIKPGASMFLKCCGRQYFRAPNQFQEFITNDGRSRINTQSRNIYYRGDKALVDIKNYYNNDYDTKSFTDEAFIEKFSKLPNFINRDNIEKVEIIKEWNKTYNFGLRYKTAYTKIRTFITYKTDRKWFKAEVIDQVYGVRIRYVPYKDGIYTIYISNNHEGDDPLEMWTPPKKAENISLRKIIAFKNQFHRIEPEFITCYDKNHYAVHLKNFTLVVKDEKIYLSSPGKEIKNPVMINEKNVPFITEDMTYEEIMFLSTT
jgi:hypothetical protein